MNLQQADIGLAVQIPAKGPTLFDQVRTQINRGQIDSVRVAVAYASVAGVRKFLELLPETGCPGHWIIGLDDLITQPAAISVLRDLDDSRVRVCLSTSAHAPRFHPKAYYFYETDRPELPKIVLGSANLTSAAWTENCEFGSVIATGSSGTSNAAQAAWKAMWNYATPLTDEILSRYSERYTKALKYRRKIEAIVGTAAVGTTAAGKHSSPLDDDHTEIDPSQATTCWIEGGNITALGRELELKREQAIFFGLDATNANEKVVPFVASNGVDVDLRFKYQGNQMWRLQLSRTVPEVAVGLRPKLPNGKLGRSEFVAVFTRIPNGKFRLNFIRLTDSKFDKLVARTKKVGAHGSTTKRQYGWY